MSEPIVCAFCGEPVAPDRAAAFGRMEVPWGDGATLAHASPFECHALTGEAKLYYSTPRSQFCRRGGGVSRTLTTLAVRDMVALYAAGAPVEEIRRSFGVSPQTLYYHLDQTGTPRRRPFRPPVPVGEVVDLSLHVLPVIPVRLVARPGPGADRPGEEVTNAD